MLLNSPVIDNVPSSFTFFFQEELSDASRVLLRGLTLNSTGLYRCEISAEAPNFSSVQGEGRMDIVCK